MFCMMSSTTTFCWAICAKILAAIPGSLGTPINTTEARSRFSEVPRTTTSSIPAVSCIIIVPGESVRLLRT
jgi:hypothetical protein